MPTGKANCFVITPEQILWLVARVLPGALVIALGFYAAKDFNTRARWTQLLYQTGSLRPEQRDDPKVQQSVKFPFWLVGILLLWWPISYYRHINRVFEIAPTAYAPRDPNFDPKGAKAVELPTPTPDPYAILTPQPAGARSGAPAAAAPGATAPPAPTGGGFSPYGGNAGR